MPQARTLAVALLLVAVPAGALQRYGGETPVNTTTSGDQIRPTVATDASGRSLVVWETCFGPCSSGRQLNARLFDKEGAPLTGEVPIDVGFQAWPTVAATPTGWIVAWVRLPSIIASHEEIIAQRLDATGALVGGQIAVSTNTTTYKGPPSVGADGSGRFVVVWAGDGADGSSWGVIGRRFDGTGAPLVGEFQVNTYTTGAQVRPRVGVSEAGSFVVVWDGASASDPDGVAAQRFSVSVAPAGEFQVNTYTTGPQNAPDVAMDADGRFSVFWAGAGLGDPDGIFSQWYDAAGASLGAEFRVNDNAAGVQSDPDAAVELGGSVSVAWTDASGQDGSGEGIYAKSFGRTLAPHTAEVLVNAFTTGNQSAASIAAAFAGGAVVAWWSVGQDTPAETTLGGIYLQLFTGLSPISGKKLLIKDDADPGKRRIVFKSKASSIGTAPALGSLDPVANDGAYLHVYNASGSGDSACMWLPPTGWTVSGDPADPTYRFSADRFASPACKRAVLRPELFRVSCKGSGAALPIPYSLDEPSQGSVVVRLRSAGWDHCAVFGGTVAEQQGRFFRGRDATFPSSCPEPPSLCP